MRDKVVYDIHNKRLSKLYESSFCIWKVETYTDYLFSTVQGVPVTVLPVGNTIRKCWLKLHNMHRFMQMRQYRGTVYSVIACEHAKGAYAQTEKKT